MLAKIASGTTVGLEALPIEVEVDVASRGLPSLTIVGLPDKAVQEAKERVRAALQNSGADIPSRRITVNLAPGDIPKQGSAFDLPIAIGLLIAAGEIHAQVDHSLFIGELSLDGSVKPTPGALPITLMARKKNYQRIYLPPDNAQEAAVVKGIDIYPVPSIKVLVKELVEGSYIPKLKHIGISELITTQHADIDFQDIYGQDQAKRAMEIAAAGSHNIFLTGLPGAGKTMLSRAFAGILPRLTEKEALEITKIYSISGLMKVGEGIITHRPFRSPHHTTSKVGLIGGGTHPRPGEISLAHRGVLFLDEFPEFPRSVVESLRQPLEDGHVHISRASHSASYPSRFTLVAAANPCPCGHYTDPVKACHCTPGQISKYHKKISGPMLDRIDIHVNVPAVDVKKLAKFQSNAEPSAVIQDRVQTARDRQSKRFNGTPFHTNAEMTTKAIKKYVSLGSKERDFLTQATARLGLTARSYFKTIKVAQTIVDLERGDQIHPRHLAEGLQYRHQESL